MTKSPPEILRQLADSLENIENFAGLALFIPPEGEEKYLILRSGNPNDSFFWNQASALLQVTIADIETKERRSPWG